MLAACPACSSVSASPSKLDLRNSRLCSRPASRISPGRGFRQRAGRWRMWAHIDAVHATAGPFDTAQDRAINLLRRLEADQAAAAAEQSDELIGLALRESQG